MSGSSGGGSTYNSPNFGHSQSFGRTLLLSNPSGTTPMEGSLSKWTNVMKGWQFRWFMLDENTGLLSYYTVCCMFLFRGIFLPGFPLPTF